MIQNEKIRKSLGSNLSSNLDLSFKIKKNNVKNRKRKAAFNIFDSEFLIRNSSKKQKKNRISRLRMNRKILPKMCSFKFKFKNLFKEKIYTYEERKKHTSIKFVNKRSFSIFNTKTINVNLKNVKNNIKEFTSVFYIFLNLNKEKEFFCLKQFIKIFAAKNKIKNKKFHYLFLNQKNIDVKKNKVKFKYILLSLLFLDIIDVDLTKEEDKKKVNIENKAFDHLFYKKILFFLTFLKKKIKKSHNKKIKYYEKMTKKVLKSIKMKLDKKKKLFYSFKKKNNYEKENKLLKTSKMDFFFPKIADNLTFINKKNMKNIIKYNNKLRKFISTQKNQIEFFKNKKFINS